MLLNSCTKSDINQEPLNAPIAKLTNEWLNSRVKEGETIRNERIESLRQSILPSKASIETLEDGEKLIIVPIVSSLKMNTNSDKSADHYLLLFENKNKEVYKGNIVQYVPLNSQNRALPKNTLSRLWNCEDVNANGTFTVLTIFDKYLYASTFKDGKKTAYTTLEPKKNNGDVAVINAPGNVTCVEYYLITTHYYSDGSTQTFEEYLGTSCYRWCVPGEACAVKEDDGLGGGGGPDEDIEAVSFKDWGVVEVGPFSYVLSSEKLKGKKRAGLSNGGYFTKITNLGISKEGSTISTWEKTSVTGTYFQHTASSRVIGKYSLISNPTYFLHVDKTKNFTVANDL